MLIINTENYNPYYLRRKFYSKLFSFSLENIDYYLLLFGLIKPNLLSDHYNERDYCNYKKRRNVTFLISTLGFIRFLIHLTLPDDSFYLQMVFGDISIFFGGFRIYIILSIMMGIGLSLLIVIKIINANDCDLQWTEVIKYLKDNSSHNTIDLNNILEDELKFRSKLIMGICKIALCIIIPSIWFTYAVIPFINYNIKEFIIYGIPNAIIAFISAFIAGIILFPIIGYFIITVI